MVTDKPSFLVSHRLSRLFVDARNVLTSANIWTAQDDLALAVQRLEENQDAWPSASQIGFPSRGQNASVSIHCKKGE